MKKYIENTYNSFIPENKGYIFVNSDNIFIPIYKVTLSITKRKLINLNLVEEMVLQIIECGVSNIDEIAGILGIDKDILDITIGDLYNKDLIYQTANKCILMDKGKNALKELSISKKEKDSLRNIYINSLDRSITNKKDVDIIETNNINIFSKVNPIFKGDDIDFYRSKMSEIRKIFENEQYNIGSKKNIDDLVSIDSVEEINVCYLKMMIYIYISDSGTDIDIAVKDKRLSKLFENIKDTVLDQIRKHRLLKNTFKKYIVSEYIFPKNIYQEESYMQNLIKKYVIEHENQTQYMKLINENIYTNRILIDNEFEFLCEDLFKTANYISFYVDNLDYWSKETGFITLLSKIPAKKLKNIYYSTVSQINLAKKRFENSIPLLPKNSIIQNQHEYWFNIEIDEKKYIIAYPQNHKVFDDNTYIVKTKYVLNNKDING